MATQGRRRDDHPEDFDTALSCYEYVQPSLLLVPSDVEVAGLSKSVQSCKLQLLLSLPVWKLCSVKGHTGVSERLSERRQQAINVVVCLREAMLCASCADVLNRGPLLHVSASLVVSGPAWPMP